MEIESSFEVVGFGPLEYKIILSGVRSIDCFTDGPTLGPCVTIAREMRPYTGRIVAHIGCVGRDGWGKQIARDLEGENIAPVLSYSDKPTCIYRFNEKRGFGYHPYKPHANYFIGDNDEHRRLVMGSKLFYAYAIPYKESLETEINLIEKADRHNVRVGLYIGDLEDFSDESLEKLIGALDKIDIGFITSKGLSTLSRTPIIEDGINTIINEYGVKQIVVKCVDDIYAKSGRDYRKLFKIPLKPETQTDKISDATNDAFTNGYVLEYFKGLLSGKEPSIELCIEKGKSMIQKISPRTSFLSP